MTMFKFTLAALLATSAASAVLAEPLSVIDAATPAYLAKTDPAVHFPAISSSFAKEGRFVAPSNIRMIAPGMSRQQVYALVAEPMFSELLPFQKSWNYIFNFYTGHGDDSVQCQYQIQWSNGNPQVTGAYWKDAACAKYVADETPPPEPVKPVPVPVPAPAVRTERSYVIYFPFDKSDVTAEAQAIVRDAAAYAKDGRGAHLAIVGFTDSSGSARYDEALSERRAKAVADAFVAAGLDASGLDVSWKGKTDLAVPTPDGTKEPLNRRATIVVKPVG